MDQSVQVAGGDETADEVGDAIGFDVGEVELLAADDSAGRTEGVEPVEDTSGGRQCRPIGESLHTAPEDVGNRLELITTDGRGVRLATAGGRHLSQMLI